MQDLLLLTSALSDQNRLRALMSLRGGPLCVCQIVELLQLAPSTVSKHLTILRQAGLVEAEKKGRWMYYAPMAKPDAAAQKALEFVQTALKDDPEIRQDNKRLKTILKEDPQEICRRQTGRCR